jgi:hypothetical protein
LMIARDKHLLRSPHDPPGTLRLRGWFTGGEIFQ